VTWIDSPSVDPVLLEVAGAVATVRLNRPECGNALDLETLKALRVAADELARMDDVRAVLVRSGGPSFCAGGDLRWMAAQDDRRAAVRTLATELHGALLALRALDAPIITVIQGTTAGAGVSLAASADIALAAEAATFTMAYTRVGLSPDGGCTWLLPRLIGQQRAAELILLNTRVDATEAARIGLVARVIPDEQLDAEAARLAEGLRNGARAANAAVKRLIAASARSSLPEQLELEAASIAKLAASPEGREGIESFLDGRRPHFRAMC
jgi:2-(1,2-epoxy-1,2-dihydrophenyl)acetyl-CoA isomerase